MSKEITESVQPQKWKPDEEINRIERPALEMENRDEKTDIVQSIQPKKWKSDRARRYKIIDNNIESRVSKLLWQAWKL